MVIFGTFPIRDSAPGTLTIHEEKSRKIVICYRATFRKTKNVVRTFPPWLLIDFSGCNCMRNKKKSNRRKCGWLSCIFIALSLRHSLVRWVISQLETERKRVSQRPRSNVSSSALNLQSLIAGNRFSIPQLFAFIRKLADFFLEMICLPRNDMNSKENGNFLSATVGM